MTVAIVLLLCAGLALGGVLLYLGPSGPEPVGPPAEYSWLRLGMPLHELKKRVPKLKQTRPELALFEERPDPPDPYNMVTYLFPGGSLGRVVFFLDRKKASADAYQRLVDGLEQRFGRPPDVREATGKNPERTWCDKLACLGVHLLPVAIQDMAYDNVYLTFQTRGAFDNRSGGVKIFDMTGKLPVPPKP